MDNSEELVWSSPGALLKISEGKLLHWQIRITAGNWPSTLTHTHTHTDSLSTHTFTDSERKKAHFKSQKMWFVHVHTNLKKHSHTNVYLHAITRKHTFIHKDIRQDRIHNKHTLRCCRWTEHCCTSVCVFQNTCSFSLAWGTLLSVLSGGFQGITAAHTGEHTQGE